MSPMIEANMSNLTTPGPSGVPSVTDLDVPTGALTAQDVDEFRTILRDTCGEEMSSEEAWKRATAVSALARMLLGPIPEDPGHSTDV